MFGTHLEDASSRTSNHSSHPQDASDNTDKKQQAPAAPNVVLAKNSATLCEALAKNLHHDDADKYAETYYDDSHDHPHNANNARREVVSNISCYYAPALQQQDNTSTSVMPQGRWDASEKYDGYVRRRAFGLP